MESTASSTTPKTATESKILGNGGDQAKDAELILTLKKSDTIKKNDDAEEGTANKQHNEDMEQKEEVVTAAVEEENEEEEREEIEENYVEQEKENQKVARVMKMENVGENPLTILKKQFSNDSTDDGTLLKSVAHANDVTDKTLRRIHENKVEKQESKASNQVEEVEEVMVKEKDDQEKVDEESVEEDKEEDTFKKTRSTVIAEKDPLKDCTPVSPVIIEATQPRRNSLNSTDENVVQLPKQNKLNNQLKDINSNLDVDIKQEDAADEVDQTDHESLNSLKRQQCELLLEQLAQQIQEQQLLAQKLKAENKWEQEKLTEQQQQKHFLEHHQQAPTTICQSLAAATTTPSSPPSAPICQQNPIHQYRQQQPYSLQQQPPSTIYQSTTQSQPETKYATYGETTKTQQIYSGTPEQTLSFQDYSTSSSSAYTTSMEPSNVTSSRNERIDLNKIFEPATDSEEIQPKNRKLYASSAFYSPTLHPTMEDQVELARRISHSLSDISNKQSKGQSMYVNRKKRSVKWVHDGQDYQQLDPLSSLHRQSLKPSTSPNLLVAYSDAGKHRVQLNMHQEQLIEKYSKPGLMVLKTPWEAALETGSASTAFIEEPRQHGVIAPIPISSSATTPICYLSASSPMSPNHHQQQQLLCKDYNRPASPYYPTGGNYSTTLAAETSMTGGNGFCASSSATPTVTASFPRGHQRELAYKPSLPQGWKSPLMSLPKELYVPREIPLESYAPPPKSNNKHVPPAHSWKPSTQFCIGDCIEDGPSPLTSKFPIGGNQSRTNTNYNSYSTSNTTYDPPLPVALVGSAGTTSRPSIISFPLSPLPYSDGFSVCGGYSVVPPPKQEYRPPNSYQTVPQATSKGVHVQFQPSPLPYDKLAKFENDSSMKDYSGVHNLPQSMHRPRHFLWGRGTSKVRSISPIIIGGGPTSSGFPLLSSGASAGFMRTTASHSPPAHSLSRPRDLSPCGQNFNNQARGWKQTGGSGVGSGYSSAYSYFSPYNTSSGTSPRPLQHYHQQAGIIVGDLPYTDF